MKYKVYEYTIIRDSAKIGKGTVIATTLPILRTPLYKIRKTHNQITIRPKKTGMLIPPNIAGLPVSPRKFLKNNSAFDPHRKSIE